MSVHKRRWTTAQGVEREAWQADYVDQAGKRHRKNFKLKKDAEAFEKRASTEVADGAHVADAASATIAEAGKLWIAAKERAGRERTTVDQYRQHLNLHIVPFIGEIRMNAFTLPAARAFEERLADNGRSPAMIRKILVSLGSLIGDAQERGLCNRNPIRDMRGRRGSADARAQKRATGKLRVGVDIPSPEEVRAILANLEGRWRPLLVTAIFTGLRSSELRGLCWRDVDLEKRVLHVRQRADRFKAIGRPKSEAGEREVPLPPIVANTLKDWKKAGTKSDKGLVFPNLKGEPEAHQPIIAMGFAPAQIRAGVTRETGDLDAKGNPILAPKYTGLHCLRHFHASWLINRRADGGLELPPKVVQERLGHSTIAMTLNVYGHLFPRGDDGSELAAAEAALFG
ncbi:Site-specific recombinase XerD [Devosia enhydra]|uniref:Site-specific recombinase XerD n=1 Tax=Devosia enhydra TaxID=665118 RepID=A0A1K2HVH9_9HYPH|nr:site-specific integrase [Devosia enhydra]SFZ82392.1 Site-specific recombinase XerD [Devosia enhydra]